MLKVIQSSGLLIILLFIITACDARKPAANIVIEGFIKNLPDGKVYLTEASDWEIVLDSANAKSGQFRFHLKSDSSFVPLLVSIHYLDSTFTEYHQIRRLLYRNTYESKGKFVSSTDAFFLGREDVMIKGNKDSVAALQVLAGKDNELYQRLMGKGFGYIGNIDSAKRSIRMHYFKNQVKQNPYSYFLFGEIFNNKEDYTEKELEDLLIIFSKDVQKSKFGESFSIYLANRPNPNTPYPNLLLLDSRNEKNRILSLNHKLNILIFWASWCGPCRKEIPALKKVHQTFRDKGLHMVSISIDEKQDNWYKAIIQESMEWQQFIVQKDQLKQVKQQFNFNAIPYIVLTDSSGKEIIKITGYSENNITNINTTISKYLTVE